MSLSWIPNISGNLVYSLSTGVVHYLVGSFFFDLVHWQAHRSHRSRFRIFRFLAHAHTAHHQYFDRNLVFNNKFMYDNLTSHMPLEFLCQVIGSTLSWLCCAALYHQTVYVLAIVLGMELSRAFTVAWNLGRDSNHLAYRKLPKDPYSIVVGPQYHALHHVDPQNYFGSLLRCIDWILGTASTLRGRRVTMTGSSGSFGRALSKQLTDEVACIKGLRYGTHWSYDNYAAVEPILADTDILILAHGSKKGDVFQANCESAATLIELFKQARTEAKPELKPEVWYVGSEAEFHGCWEDSMKSYTNSKRAFAEFAKGFYNDEDIVYRHIVPASFQSGMGLAIVSAEWAAKTALWWIRRGARYVPVTYTGLAFANYFRFVYWLKPKRWMLC